MPLQNIRAINRAVCLAIGSFCQENKYEEGDGGSIEGIPGADLVYPRGLNTMTQFIAFEYWLSLLKTRAKISEVVFQDPAFNKVDRAFLASRGFHTVLSEGEAEETITAETFLFAPVGNVINITMHCLSVGHPRCKSTSQKKLL